LTYPVKGGGTSRRGFTGRKGAGQGATAFSTSSYGWLQGIRIGISGGATTTLYGNPIHGLNGRGVHYGFRFGKLLYGLQ